MFLLFVAFAPAFWVSQGATSKACARLEGEAAAQPSWAARTSQSSSSQSRTFCCFTPEAQLHRLEDLSPKPFGPLSSRCDVSPAWPWPLNYDDILTAGEFPWARKSCARGDLSALGSLWDKAGWSAGRSRAPEGELLIKAQLPHWADDLE